jgi:ribose transport system substrate-binding protein
METAHDDPTSTVLTRQNIMNRNLRFALVPKVAHPWFEEVHVGALEEAERLGRELGIDIAVDYVPPSRADVRVQNSILETAAAARPDGITVDPVDVVSHMAAIREIRERGIPVVLFDSPSPDADITSVGNDFAEQGTIAAERLVSLIGQRGKVAIMQGFPTAPNHRERYQAQLAALTRYPNISVVDGGIDCDDIGLAREQAAGVLASNPDLSGYLCCDASAPIGIAEALRQTGRAGRVKVVGMDGIRPILQAIKEGILESSVATIPRMRGSMAVLMLWQATLGVRTPRRVDTGIDVITQENVDAFLAAG